MRTTRMVRIACKVIVSVTRTWNARRSQGESDVARPIRVRVRVRVWVRSDVARPMLHVRWCVAYRGVSEVYQRCIRGVRWCVAYRGVSEVYQRCSMVCGVCSIAWLIVTDSDVDSDLDLDPTSYPACDPASP